MDTRTAVLVVVAISIVATTIVSGALIISQTYPNTGGILKSIGVEVFWDRACTNRVSTVPWGTLAPGQNKTHTVFIRNNGTAAETLTIAYGNWNPSSVSSKLTLGWNCTNHLLPHASVVCATMWMSVSPSANATTSFTFDTTITGTEHA